MMTVSGIIGLVCGVTSIIGIIIVLIVIRYKNKHFYDDLNKKENEDGN